MTRQRTWPVTITEEITVDRLGDGTDAIDLDPPVKLAPGEYVAILDFDKADKLTGARIVNPKAN